MNTREFYRMARWRVTFEVWDWDASAFKAKTQVVSAHTQLEAVEAAGVNGHRILDCANLGATGY
jgi:hypothetical protein